MTEIERRGIGEDRVLFASDEPWSDFWSEYWKINGAPVSREAQRTILYQNYERYTGARPIVPSRGSRPSRSIAEKLQLSDGERAGGQRSAATRCTVRSRGALPKPPVLASCLRSPSDEPDRR